MKTKQYTLSDFDYDLPSELIAQHPLPERTASRLLHIGRNKQSINPGIFSDIEQLLNPGDLLVLNNTRVIPARLFGHKQTGGKFECLIERILPNNIVLAHIRCSKSPKSGMQLCLPKDVNVKVLGRQGELFEIAFPAELDMFEYLEEAGQLPLPPYIERAPEGLDKERYQTVFAKEKGAVAAPTASLHFNMALLERLQNKGIKIVYITLHVGAGTFQPVRNEDLDQHKMHSEIINVAQDVCDAILHCKNSGNRVVAVGTTVMRSLESAARSGNLKPYQGETDIFIRPGFKFNVVDAMITNFHLPKSTLLMLVSAFAGYDLMRQAYEIAKNEKMRFFSYGDAMFIQ